MHFYIVTGRMAPKNGYSRTVRVGVVATGIEGAIATAKLHSGMETAVTASHQGKVDVVSGAVIGGLLAS